MEKLSPVPAEQQAAFKAEVPALRKTLKAIERARRKSRPDLLQRLQTQNATCLVRLEHWDGILSVGHTIRSPVRLWDIWASLRNRAEMNAVELNDLSAAAGGRHV